ncbi:MAG: tetratricopeptide repeat protein [Bryobacteraceae bacterium]|nr:tetratricopeptide repeat protein [Bryobacteraceae bacterium]
MRLVSRTWLCIAIAFAADALASDVEVQMRVRAAEESLARLALPEAEQHLVIALAASDSAEARATILNNLGFVYHKRGKYDQAERCYMRAMGLWEQIPAADELFKVRSIGNLAMHYVETRQFDKVERLGLEVLASQLSGQERGRQDLARILSSLGALERSRQGYSKAEGHLNQALTIWDAVKPGSVEVLEVLNNLALVYEQAGKAEEALLCYQRAQQIAAAALRAADVRNAILLANIAALQYRTHRLAEAELSLQHALPIAESALGSEHPTVGTLLCNYGVVLRGLKKRAEAGKLEKRGEEILRRTAVQQGVLHTIDISELVPRSVSKH